MEGLQWRPLTLFWKRASWGVAVQWVGHLRGGPESPLSMVMRPKALIGELVIHSSDVHAFSRLPHPERGAQLTKSSQLPESLVFQEEDLMKCLQMGMFCTGEQQQYPPCRLMQMSVFISARVAGGEAPWWVSPALRAPLGTDVVPSPGQDSAPP